MVDAAGMVGGILSNASAATPTVGTPGRGLAFNATSHIQIVDATDARFDLSGEATMVVLCIPNDASGGQFGQYAIGSGKSDASQSQMAIRIKGTADIQWGGSTFVTGATSLTTGQLCMLGATRSGSTGAWVGTVYFNGKFDSSASVSENPGAQQVLSLGTYGASDSFSLPLTGSIFAAMVWNRALTPAEHLSLYVNPWQLFVPEEQRLLVVTGGPNIYTLSPSGGVVFSGSATQVHENVVPVSGGVAFSGSAPEIRTRVQVPSGSVVFSGTAPITFTNGQTFVLSPSGGFILSGSAPEVRTRAQVPIGGVAFGGGAALIRTDVWTPSGGVAFGGSAPMSFVPAGGVPSQPQRMLTGVGQ